MNPFRYRISLRLRHPSMRAEVITEALGMRPRFRWNAGDQRSTPQGQPLEGTYPTTYWCSDAVKAMGFDLEERLRVELAGIEPHSDFLALFTSTRGSIEYYVGWSICGMNTGSESPARWRNTTTPCCSSRSRRAIRSNLPGVSGTGRRGRHARRGPPDGTGRDPRRSGKLAQGPPAHSSRQATGTGGDSGPAARAGMSRRLPGMAASPGQTERCRVLPLRPAAGAGGAGFHGVSGGGAGGGE